MLGKFKLSDSSIELLKDTNTGIARRMSVLSEFNPEVERIILDLKNTLFQIFEEAYTGGRITENFRENNGVLEAYTDFLSKAVVLSYYGLFDNDKNLAKLRQRAEERGEDKRIDFMFGFQGLFNVVAIAVGIIEDRDVPTDKVAGRSMSNLLSSIRQIEVGEYLDGGYADMDIELIVLLGNHSESELNDFVMSYIKSDNTLNSCYMDTLAQVMTVYKYLFQDSFGLRPYVGVLSFQAPYIQVIDDTMHLNTISTARSSFEIISSVLKESFKVREMMDRQFDVKTIIRGSDSTPYYYPVKMLEYAMGRELTYELSENVYRNFANNKSWEDYAEGYVEPNMKKYFMDCIYYSLERHFEFGGVRGSDTNDFFSSEEFSAILEEYGENAVKVYLSGAQMMSGVMNDLEKLKRSLCTAVAVVRYNNLGNKVNAVTIRIVNTVGNALSVTTGDLYGSFTTNRNTKFDSGDIISKGKCIGGDASKPLPYDIIEFRHDFDSALATAEPLFGYKAVEMFRNRGIKLGWDKILLGEDIKGTPVFASLGDVDDFPMQSKVVHNMMAGSRSGKGVMTMNMLASGIASGKPIFYIDRKPDMAVLFYELSQGNMFVVNGGQYEGKNDINKYFSDEGVAVSGWAEAYERMPPYLKKAFFSAKTYSGNFGDYVYFRAVMFMLGILMARVELAGDAAIFNAKGQTEQIVHPDYAFVAQCRSRVNNAVPGANLWEQIRIKHLKSEAMAEDAENGIDRHYGELNEGIGFQGLASQTKMCNGMGNFIPTRDLDASRAIADYVAQCMGYSGYMDLLFDFSPKGLFSTQDVCNALANPKAYQTSLNERLPLFVEYNFLNEADSKTVHVADIKNSTFYNESLYDNLGKPDEKNIKSGGTGQSSVNRDDLNHGKRHMGSVNQGNVNRGGAGQSSVNQGKRHMGSAAFGMSGWDDESENDTQMSQDDLIALCTKVTTNVFLTFYKRYGNNVKDEKVHNYITEYARSVIYEYIHG